jgi:hypothetical protein
MTAVDLTYMARIWRVFGFPKLGKAANDSPTATPSAALPGASG